MKPFYVGLTMAGAISAGAYTAGVFDFLLEALEEWEKQKKARRDAGTKPEDWDIPGHDVIVPVMSGASAGAITGALGVIALAEATEAGGAKETIAYPDVGEVTTGLPRLYRAWVRMPAFVSPGGGPDLLGTDDLDAAPGVRSLLDTTVLDEIVRASVTGIKVLGAPRPYIGEFLHVFMTHTNLRGVPYEIEFMGGLPGQPGYPMMCHGDRVHYRVSGIGSAPFASAWADPDSLRRIDVATLKDLSRVEGEWAAFATAAVGSGAFPVGLTARAIEGVTVGDYQGRQWPIRRHMAPAAAGAAGGQMFRLHPTFPPPLGDKPGNAVGYVTSDGGMIDNEPFELARWTLMEKPPEPNPRLATKTDRAVIMIDPFPAPPDYDAAGRLDTALAAVIKAVFPTFVEQARFKPDELADALDETVCSRFLIAPRRCATRGGEPEHHAIASGLLGGFGGFASEDFRAHDYQLGRLNCYLFLKDSFALPADNEIIKAGYGIAALANPAFQTSHPDKNDPSQFHQIIPLTGSAAAAPAVPRWPRIDQAAVETIVGRAKERAGAVLARLAAKEIRSRAMRLGLRTAWLLWGKSILAGFVRWTLIKNLVLRDQLQAWQALQGDERKVVAGLADPRYDLRTTLGIAAQFHLDGAAVSQAIHALDRAGLIRGGGRVGGRETYALEERAPGLLGNIASFIGVGRPSVD